MGGMGLFFFNGTRTPLGQELAGEQCPLCPQFAAEKPDRVAPVLRPSGIKRMFSWPAEGHILPRGRTSRVQSPLSPEPEPPGGFQGAEGIRTPGN